MVKCLVGQIYPRKHQTESRCAISNIHVSSWDQTALRGLVRFTAEGFLDILWHLHPSRSYRLHLKMVPCSLCSVLPLTRALHYLGCSHSLPTIYEKVKKAERSVWTHSVRSSGSRSAEWPSSKATSVKSRAWYSPRLTGQDRRAPLRTRHNRTLSRPQDTILERKYTK